MPICVLYGDLSAEKRISRLMRNNDRFISATSGSLSSSTIEAMTSTSCLHGWRRYCSYSSRCESNQGLLLLRLRPCRNLNVSFVKSSNGAGGGGASSVNFCFFMEPVYRYKSVRSYRQVRNVL